MVTNIEKVRLELRDFHSLTMILYINDMVKQKLNSVQFKHFNKMYRIEKSVNGTFIVMEE